MKKIFLITISSILLIILLSNAFSSLAIAQTTTEPSSSSSTIQIKSAGAIFQNIKNIIKEKARKMAGLKMGGVIGKIKAWFSERKEAIKMGWQEEKQEFHGNIKDIIADAWQKAINKVKSWVFHKKED